MVGIVTGGSALVAAGLAYAGYTAYSEYNASQQASDQAGLARDALGMAQTTQGEQQYYNSLLQQLLANPSSVTSLPGYKFQLDQGSKAVADQMSASGFAGSGNEAAALTQFGQGLASSFYGQQASLLASLSGVTAASSPAQNVNAATGASALSTNTLSQLLNSLGFFGTLGAKSGMFGGASAGTPAAFSAMGGAADYGAMGGGGNLLATEFAGALA